MPCGGNDVLDASRQLGTLQGSCEVRDIAVADLPSRHSLLKTKLSSLGVLVPIGGDGEYS
jgi:hypothetical protein